MANPARADDQSLPMFRTFGGAFLTSSDHNFFVESELQLPIYRHGPSGLYYRHQETTPFLDLDQGVQAEHLYVREEAQIDFVINPYLRLIAVGGYEHVQFEDRTGSLSAFSFGGGLGSPFRANGQRLQWYLAGGTYANRLDIESDWWGDFYGAWRIYDFIRDRYLGSEYHASINLAARVESSNEGDHLQAMYRVGPELQLRTASGNRANLGLSWYRNDGNPFYGRDEKGTLFGLEVSSSRDDAYVFNAREERQPGWFPLIWGDYDIAFGGERRTQRFTMNVELADFDIAAQRFTGFVWYESHQERRVGQFDNINYSVTLGVQTTVGLESFLSQGQPLVAGLDFLHRSDHALNPSAARVTADGEPTSIGPLLPNGSINILPRLRLQTQGWDMPYRDSHMYDRKTEWLHYFDWRVTAGLTTSSSRPRRAFSGQVGLNWDIATVQGYVAYLQGVGSIGDETPDWRGEIGVRRPAVKLFARAQSYGVTYKIARGNILVVGLGVNL